MKTEQIEFTFLELDQQGKDQAIINYNIDYYDLYKFFESIIKTYFKRNKNNEFFREYICPILESFVIQDFDYQKNLLQIDFDNYVISNSNFKIV